MRSITRHLWPRKSERRPTLTQAYVAELPEGRKQGCIVSNFSERGVLVLLESDRPLRPKAVLSLPEEGICIPVRTAWQKGSRAGLQFVSGL